MNVPRFVIWMSSIIAIISGAGAISAQSYPNKPIRMLAPAAGGAGDVAARIIAHGLTDRIGQQVVVNNGPQLTNAEKAKDARPDGYTILQGSGSFFLGPLMRKSSYDPEADFSPITLATSAPALLISTPSLPVKTVKELIALAKTKPGELNYGSGAAGGGTHLAMELFKTMAGVNIVRIPYSGDGPVTIALMGNQIQVAFVNTGSALPHVKAGRVRALGIASAQPSPLLPGMPTVASAGLPGFESGSLVVIVAPLKTPTAIVNRLNQEIVRVLNTPDVKEKFFSNGVDIVGSTPEQLMVRMKSERASAAKIINDAGLAPQ